MARYKSYTDVPQSCNLAVFLSPESADLYYNLGESPIPEFIVGSHSDYRCYDLCWSLTALLSVLNYPELIQEFSDRWTIRAWNCGNQYVEHGFSDPVDACYEMIMELHKNNIL